MQHHNRSNKKCSEANMDHTHTLHIDPARVRRAFERAAANYDTHAVLQREVAQRMDERLEDIRYQPRRILDIGSGTGHGAALLRLRYPQATVFELDLTEKMLQIAASKQRQNTTWMHRLFNHHQPCRICADMNHLPLADASMDMIWSNLALQWLSTPDSALQEFIRVLKPGGMLMFSTLGPDTLHELRNAFLASNVPSAVHPFIDMHDIGDALLRAGLAEPVMDMEKIVMSYTNFKAVLHDIKAGGSHNATESHHHNLTGKRRWQLVNEYYEQLRQNGRLPATYEIVYGHAWRGTEKPHRQNEPQVVNFVR